MKSPDKFTLTAAQPILRILATLTQAFDRGVLWLVCNTILDIGGSRESDCALD
jgi:hypothetical protein